MPTSISSPDLAARIGAGSVRLVEALSPDFYAAGHLPGATNLPLDSTDAELSAFAAASAIPIVVYGTRFGGEATELAARIEAVGDAPVIVYDGGKEAWVEAGHPLSTAP